MGDAVHDGIHAGKIEPESGPRGAVQQGHRCGLGDIAHRLLIARQRLFGEPHERPRALAVKPVGVEADRVLGIERPEEQHEPQGGEHQQPEALGDMRAPV